MNILSSIIGDIPVIGPIINDVGSKILDAGKNEISSGNGVNDVLTLLGVLNSAGLQKKADSYANNALSSAQSAYDAKAPLRTAGISGLQFSSTHGNPFAAGFQGPSTGLPVAGLRPSPVGSGAILPTAGQPSTDIQDGSALPTLRAPSVGMASTPPNPGNAGTPPSLRVATTPGGGTAPKGLKVANALEMQKLFA